MSYESVVLADSPTLLWMMNETSGTAAADATGNGNTGTYDAGYTLGGTGPPGVSTYAALFDGSTGFVYKNSSVASPDTFSVECWFRTSESCGIAGFSAGQGENATQDRSISVDTGGNLQFYVYPFAIITSGTNYANGNWHYLAGTWDNSDSTANWQIFADGSLAVSNADGSSFDAYDYTGYWLAALIGGTPSGGNPVSSLFLDGTLSAFAVYPAVLTATQVSNHYNAASGPAFLARPNRPRGQAVNRASTY